MNQQLAERIRLCPNLPSLPAIAMEVLDLAQRPDVDITVIAKTISKDPALAGKILRTVNSSFYARSNAVSTISHALVILGLQSVKTLVLGFSLVSNLSKNRGKGFQHLTYWKRSIYSATAARSIAAKISLVQQEEAFLAALLKDIGMLVLDQVLGEAYGEVHARASTHEQLAGVEAAALGLNHAEAGGLLAGQWKLPPLLLMPIAYHHAPEQVADPPLRRLTEVVHLSGRCADVYVDALAAEAITHVRKLAHTYHGMSAAEADDLLDEIGRRTHEVASLFEIPIGPAGDFEAILKKANETLVELTLRSQQQVTEFKEQATSLQQQAMSLVQQNEQLKVQATTDGLTGLANRTV